MRIPSAVIPAVLVYALGGGYGNIPVSPFFQEHSRSQKQRVNKGVDRPVMAEISMGRSFVNFIDYGVGKLYNYTHSPAAGAEIAVVHLSEAHV